MSDDIHEPHAATAIAARFHQRNHLVETPYTVVHLNDLPNRIQLSISAAAYQS